MPRSRLTPKLIKKLYNLYGMVNYDAIARELDKIGERVVVIDCDKIVTKNYIIEFDNIMRKAYIWKLTKVVEL